MCTILEAIIFHHWWADISHLFRCNVPLSDSLLQLILLVLQWNRSAAINHTLKGSQTISCHVVCLATCRLSLLYKNVWLWPSMNTVESRIWSADLFGSRTITLRAWAYVWFIHHIRCQIADYACMVGSNMCYNFISTIWLCMWYCCYNKLLQVFWEVEMTCRVQ